MRFLFQSKYIVEMNLRKSSIINTAGEIFEAVARNSRNFILEILRTSASPTVEKSMQARNYY